MPTRSLHSCVLKWPDARTVVDALKNWAAEVLKNRKDVKRIGFFGSYARGDWGVGSDLDLVIIAKRVDEPYEKRSTKWDLSSIPVPADLLVYTEAEWESLDRQRRFTQMLKEETVWIYIENQ